MATTDSVLTCVFLDDSGDECGKPADSRLVLEGVSERTNRVWQDIEEGCQAHIKDYALTVFMTLDQHLMLSKKGVRCSVEIGVG